MAKKATKKKAAPKKKAVKKAAKKAPKKAAKKAAKKAPKAKKVKKAGAKRKLNPALLKPYQPSAILGAVVGNNPIPRSQVVKKMWVYIKANKLQDSKNRRMINADEKLKPIFSGKSQVSMFEMAKHLSKHLK